MSGPERWNPDPDADGFVRPFIVTGGRTRPVDGRLRVETMITALPAALSAPLGFERRRIVEACQRPLAVAEAAHLLRVPVGVARVLVADLIAEGLVTVHRHVTVPHSPGHPSLALLERIRDGVRAL
ncbi:DUF742 domain-containing protein [Actinomadura macrotermitis]|uniref:DUF742 domain-containing protein n=1 Tax=Actinomadura macrotermitis TaxID=2585200 RepID=A0A7K0BXH7_9ACTN|nr:DUF742 domain-containing protein [Actinomadura macrotermitis]MQY05883.1 hypothetical protein [Actinomadura macrotermitis]